MPQNTPFKYLFTASFEDGAVIVQSVEDKSIIDPEKRNTWYDVQQILKSKKLVSFVLTRIEDGVQFGVDLRDGHFEIDGQIFWMHEVENKDVDPMSVTHAVELKDFRIVYFLTNTRSFTANVSVGGDMSKPQQVEHKRVYRFGWQATDAAGKNYQQIMQLD